MIKLTLSFWESGKKLNALMNACQRWWNQVETWLQIPLAQLDPNSCSLGVLDLIAWQRDITRFTGEPLYLYRLRVKYAYINARDAGSTVGLKRILERLGVGYVEIDERQPDRDWDIITIRLTDSQLSDNSALLQVIIQQYGRTCRRYEWSVITPMTMSYPAQQFYWDHTTVSATL